MAAHDTPCPTAIKLEADIENMKQYILKHDKTLYGNGDREKSIVYIVDELYNEVFNRKRDWPLIVASAIAILGVLVSIWYN